MALDPIETARVEIAKIYIAAFGRVPDAGGLDNWYNQYAAGLMTYDEIAQDFTNQPEYQATYPAIMTNSEYITAIYNNVFGRAPDAGGLQNWVNQLDAGVLDRGNIMYSMLQSAAEPGNDDGVRLENMATFGIQTILDKVPTDVATAELANITADPATVTAAEAAVATAVNPGETVALTTGVDTLTGTEKNDTFNAILDGTNSTLTALDTIDGAGGTDTLNINEVIAAPLPTVTVSNVETINLRSAGAATINTSTGFTGLETLNVTQGTATTIDAATTTDVNVSGITGAIDVDGGKTVVVNDATAAQTITIGAITVPAGTITITDTDNTGANTIDVDGGTDVTITTTADKATSAAINVGQGGAATDLPTGAVVVTQNTTSDGTAATAGNVTVTGGSTIDITANMTNTATTGKGADITAGIYTAIAGDATTEVTITQNATATDLAAVTTGNVTETAAITFGALAAGEAALVGVTGGATCGTDLTFIATKALTGAEVAAAFAELTATDTQAAGGITANGYFTGTLDAGWTSSAVSGSTVTFTSTTADTDVPNLEVYTDADGAGAADNGAADDATFAAVTTAGAAGTTVVAQNISTDYGVVVVDDNATASITTITLDGYDTATLGLGAGGSLDALTTLNLSNSTGANALTSTSTTLTANLDGITGATNLGGNVATLTVNTSGTATSTALTAGGLKYLTVNAGANLTVTPTSIAALETLTVTGAGNVAMGDISAATTTITAGSATGAISATVDGTKATVTTGSGNDSITVDTATQTKDIDLGDGDDTLTYSTATMGVPTGTTDGGAGTDTIAMTSSSAQSLDANTNFASAITSFERLTIVDRIDVTGGVTIDTKNLGFADYVSLAGGTDDSTDDSGGADDGDTLTLSNMAANATVVLSNTQTVSTGDANDTVAVVATLEDATGSSDVFNVIVDVEDATTNVGTLTVNDVETINITAKGLFADTDNNGIDDTPDVGTLDLNADSVTTLNIDGSADLTLSGGMGNLTTINASAMTGALTVSFSLASMTVTGGAGDDVIGIAATADSATVNGGAGADTFNVDAGADLVVLTGGAGADTFSFAGGSTNKSNYAVIQGVDSGDTISIGVADAFSATQITLAQGATESTQAYLDQAVTNLALNEMGWFQYNGNTFIVADLGSDSSNSFVDGTDAVVMITGLVDLGTDASFNTAGTLEIA
ncbi:beta strand repeat-containing protein [Sulfurimonas hydrogeniphila]|uniref:beta strand repeat-containing protein n=2 Tax=Bacteria TaxID=2 RepID=UPI00125F45F4|nr:DUF4214 domain-containing protein [Sulfurimonas hydrogeniphila]